LSEGKPENPFSDAKALRSRTWSPIAIAGLFSTWECLLVMIPKGMLAREKGLSAGIESQDLRGAIAKVLMLHRNLEGKMEKAVDYASKLEAISAEVDIYVARNDSRSARQ
jgi:hypothetical protein